MNETNTSTSTSTSKLILMAFFALLAFRLIAAAFLPIATDEAYYAMWGQVPDWGYFDHPPVTGWLAALVPAGAHVFWLRLPGIIVASLAFWVQLRTFRMLGMSLAEQTAAVLILCGSLLGLLFGFLLTPDLPQILFWSLMVHELVAALYVDSRRWLSLGVVFGLGFLSKYTMILWLPVLLWVVSQNLSLLKNRYLYGGAAFCLLVISPHLWWQVDNDFLAFKFQINHGIHESREVSAITLNTDLPQPEAQNNPEPLIRKVSELTAEQKAKLDIKAGDADQDEPRYELAQFADTPEGDIEAYFASQDAPKKVKTKKIKPQWQIVFDRINEYLGIVLAPLGFIAINAIFYGLYQLIRRLMGRGREADEGREAGETAKTSAGSQAEQSKSSGQDDGLPLAQSVQKKSLLWVCSLSPVAFFGAIALFSKVEANWPAAYLITAAPLLALWFCRHRKLLSWGIALNTLAVVALIIHANYPAFAKKPHKDRVLVESHGYKNLAQLLNGLEVPLFADTYQNVSMLSHYNPELKVQQWPGITRYSELVRRKDFGYHQHADIGKDDGFYILTNHRRPVKLQGYHPRMTSEIRDCMDNVTSSQQQSEAKGGPLAPRQQPGTIPKGLEVNKVFAEGGYQPRCKRFAHSWYLTRYEVIR